MCTKYDDVTGKVHKMAGVGGAGEKGEVGLPPDSSAQVVSAYKQMCRKNGLSHAYRCSEKSCKSVECKKSEHSVKSARQTGVIPPPPSIPCLRSRRSLPTDLLQGKRRSSKLDRQTDAGRYDKHSAVSLLYAPRCECLQSEKQMGVQLTYDLCETTLCIVSNMAGVLSKQGAYVLTDINT